MQAASAEEVTPIGELARGMSATIQGKVTRILDEDEFRMADATGSIRVYVGWRNRVMFPVGEQVTVRGFVDDDLQSVFRPEFYAFEITRADGTVVELKTQRRIARPPESAQEGASPADSGPDGQEQATPRAPAAELTPIGALARGLSATIKGRVTRILDEDEFRMADATGSVRVYIGWQNRVTIPVGEQVTVRGFVDDDLWSIFRPEFYAFEITREDGTVVTLNTTQD
jgi:uncharacterized protein YdeI (BOF family)